MTFKGLFIDDQETESAFAATLSQANVIELTFVKPQDGRDLTSQVLEANPAIVLIDYRLDEGGTDGSAAVNYKGSGLAQNLRDKAIENSQSDCPLVLVSAEAKIKSLYKHDKTAHDLFDRVYVKNIINDDRDRVRSELLALCTSYETLRGCNNKYDLLTLCDLSEDEGWVLDHQQLRVGIDEAKAPHIVARIFLRDLIDRNGLLLDDNELAALLGISRESIVKIAPTLIEGSMVYAGVFSGLSRRWWTHRLDDWAAEQFKGRATGLTAMARADALNEKFNLALIAAASPWTGVADEFVAFACIVCGRPTELKHSVSAFDHDRPKFAKVKRICWDCIQLDKHNAADPPVLVDDNDAGVAREVPNMARPAAK
jgi:hypothetical protein